MITIRQGRKSDSTARGSKSKLGAILAPGTRAPSRVDAGVRFVAGAVLGAMVMGTVLNGHYDLAFTEPVVKRVPQQVDLNVLARDENEIWTALLRYAREHGGRLPEFDSNHLPTWWQAYSPARQFDYRYVLRSAYVSYPIEGLAKSRPAQVLRTVIKVGPDGLEAPDHPS